MIDSLFPTKKDTKAIPKKSQMFLAGVLKGIVKQDARTDYRHPELIFHNTNRIFKSRILYWRLYWRYYCNRVAAWAPGCYPIAVVSPI
jgi:hypothetical protein